MKKPKFDLNKELEQIEDITYTEDDKGKYPELTEKNIRLVDKYVNEKSSYAPSKNDDFVKKYFQEKKGDISMASVITKIILIDTVDSTSLKQNLGKNYYIDFAERIRAKGVSEQQYIADGIFGLCADLMTAQAERDTSSTYQRFSATPEKSPLIPGAPPENLPTRMPRSIPLMISATDFSPALIIILPELFFARGTPVFLEI